MFISGFVIMPFSWDKLVGPANARGEEYLRQGGSSGLASFWGCSTAVAVAKALHLMFRAMLNKWM
jgi:hypothetical protein